jgi:hypothetical protein
MAIAGAPGRIEIEEEGTMREPDVIDGVSTAASVVPAVPSMRRTGGRGMHVTPAERRAIAIAYLTNADLGTVSACARHFNRTREAIAGCLKGADYERLRVQVDNEAGEDAKRILKAGRERAARAWVDTAIDAAAKSGNHKAARDLLIATKVIEPAPVTANFFVGICDGRSVRWRDSAGNVVDQLPEGASGVQIGGNVEDVVVNDRTAAERRE